jgi:hypothetical protein
VPFGFKEPCEFLSDRASFRIAKQHAHFRVRIVSVEVTPDACEGFNIVLSFWNEAKIFCFGFWIVLEIG